MFAHRSMQTWAVVRGIADRYDRSGVVVRKVKALRHLAATNGQEQRPRHFLLIAICGKRHASSIKQLHTYIMVTTTIIIELDHSCMVLHPDAWFSQCAKYASSNPSFKMGQIYIYNFFF